MATPLKPTGFWSYATLDDQYSHGRLSKLRTLLAGELQQAIGRSPVVQLFQDAAAISPGMDWERSIREAIDEASFFIPIVTPGFLQSEWCCTELHLFREREKNLGRGDLIFPIYYQDISDFETIRRGDVCDPEVLTLLRTRQWSDFRDLRHADVISEQVARQVATVAHSMRRTLYVDLSRAGGPKRAKPDIEQPTPGIGTEDPLAWFRTILTAHPWGLWIGRVLMAAALLIVVGTFMSTIGFLPHQAQFLVGVGVLLVVLGGGALVPQFLARSKGTAAPAARPGPPRRPLLIGATSSDPMEGTRRSYLVFFDWDQADLSDRGRQVIATAAQAWRAMPGKTRIEVRGFSDTAPSTARAAAVSLDRAMAVSVELVRKGVPAGIIAASGHGVSRLLVATGPNMRERMNRRVEIILRE